MEHSFDGLFYRTEHKCQFANLKQVERMVRREAPVLQLYCHTGDREV